VGSIISAHPISQDYRLGDLTLLDIVSLSATTSPVYHHPNHESKKKKKTKEKSNSRLFKSNKKLNIKQLHPCDKSNKKQRYSHYHEAKRTPVSMGTPSHDLQQ